MLPNPQSHVGWFCVMKFYKSCKTLLMVLHFKIGSLGNLTSRSGCLCPRVSAVASLFPSFMPPSACKSPFAEKDFQQHSRFRKKNLNSVLFSLIQFHLFLYENAIDALC